MTERSLMWRIAGGSGDGIDSTSQNFAKALMRSGLHVFTHRHYPSRIRGGHTYVEVRADSEPVRSRGDGFNFLLALGDSFARSPDEDAYYDNEELKPLVEHFDDLNEGGVLVYDSGFADEEDIEAVGLHERAEAEGWHVYPVDLRAIAREHGREVMRNTAGVGATAALLGMDTSYFEGLIEGAMSGEVMEANLTILDQAYQAALEFEFTHDLRVPDGTHEQEQALVSGSNAIAYGALDAGCRFISGYPMTPWTDVFTIMSQNLPNFGGISEQVEDEIAAASLAIGASHTGVKAMSGSSGGGFALMSEPLGLAEMTETPVVLVEAMRAGPSTGLPTKTEQADLEHVLYTSQGDSSRVVTAPGNQFEAYEQTRELFRIAYEYNLPAILLYDQKLGGEMRTVPASFFDREPDPAPGAVLTEDELSEAAHDAAGKYKRYATDGAEDGVNPRSVPGQKGGRHLTTGNESMAVGHISEDPDNRNAQVDRRLRKLDAIRTELDEQETSHQTAHGPPEATHGLLTWGSNQDTVFEAVDRLNARGHEVKALGVSDLMPYPELEVEAFLESVEACLVVEMNATAQFRGLTQKELGRFGPKLSSLLKYDGEPFEPGEIIDGFEANVEQTGPPTGNIKLVPGAGD